MHVRCAATLDFIKSWEQMVDQGMCIYCHTHSKVSHDFKNHLKYVDIKKEKFANNSPAKT